MLLQRLYISTLIALSNSATDDIIIIYLFIFFSEIRLGISCELSARQMIYMKCRAEKKIHTKKIKMSSAAVVISDLPVNVCDK